jgi:hypothetical protein
MRNRRNYFALVVGGILAIVTVLIMVDRISFYRTSIVSVAKVSHLNAGGHHPEIVFNAMSGQRYELPASSWWSVTAGQEVAIRYDPDDPGATVVIDSVFNIWIWAALPLILSIVFLVTAIKGESFDNVSIR